jgi:NAD(P)-dependent dehydrogenase (short-subunit alcohol dehydrogenase family)
MGAAIRGRHMVNTVVGLYDRVDILVNNAGIVSSTPLIDQTAEEWDAVQATNLRGVFVTTREVGPQMMRQGGGKIINIASAFAFKGIRNHAAYCASKVAIVWVVSSSRAMEVSARVRRPSAPGTHQGHLAHTKGA